MFSAKWRFFTYLDLFRKKKLLVQMVVHILHRASGAAMLLAGGLYRPDFMEDRLKSVAIDGGITLAIPFIVILIELNVPRFGRKALTMASQLIMCCCALVLSVLIAVYGKDAEMEVVTILSYVGTATYITIGTIGPLQHAVEYFPTVVRCLAGGFFFFVEVLFLIVLSEIAHNVSETLWIFVLTTLLCAASLVVSYQFMIETKGKPLPDNLNEF